MIIIPIWLILTYVTAGIAIGVLVTKYIVTKHSTNTVLYMRKQIDSLAIKNTELTKIIRKTEYNLRIKLME
jgi:hypothetical protein